MILLTMNWNLVPFKTIISTIFSHQFQIFNNITLCCLTDGMYFEISIVIGDSAESSYKNMNSEHIYSPFIVLACEFGEQSNCTCKDTLAH